MLTPPPLEWNGLSTPAQAPADQQIGGAAYGNGRAVPRRITDLEKEVCSVVSLVHVCSNVFTVVGQ
jgi:hypothetical protein